MFSMNSLFKRTFLLIVTVLMLFVSLFLYIFVQEQKTNLIDLMYSKANTVAKSIALVSSDAMITEGYTFLVEHNGKVLNDNEEIRYILIKPQAPDKASILSRKSVWEMLDELPSKLHRMHTGKKESKILTSRLSEHKEVYHFSYPVTFSGIKWGWVSIGYSLKTYNKQMDALYLNSLLILLTILVVSLLFSYFIAKWLIQPILSLNIAAKKVASGDLDVEVIIHSNDEVSELASSFNHMVNTVKISNEILKHTNEELELRVQMRTNELSVLNEELDHRVKEEVHKRAEQEQLLIQQSRFAAMGEMIGNIAHQWRQPLNALGLLLQNLEDMDESGSLSSEQIKRSVLKGYRLTTTMSQTIDDFRNFFQPNKKASVFSVASSIESTTSMLRSSLQTNGITLNEEIDDSVSIKGFSSEFSQVILNILSNSKDALIDNKEDSREIFLRVFNEHEKAVIEIEDNAGGIPKDILPKVFDPYFTTKDEGKGTGIGLYMSKTIIENNMNGSLTVQNTQEGAKFTIRVKREEIGTETF